MAAATESMSMVSVHAGEYFGGGLDSRVYRFGNRVLKVYRPQIDLVRVRAYQQVTNGAAALLEQEPYGGEMQIDTDRYTFYYRVNPISEVFVGEAGDGRSVMAIAPCVLGPSLIDESSLPIFKRRREIHMAGISSENEQNILRRLFFDDDSKSTLHQQDIHRVRLCHRLKQELGVSGIEIVKGNVKVRVDPQSAVVQFIITDLCASLGRLRSPV